MDTQTLLEHFERLTDAPGAVARLRESVLQLAVQGRLVEQDEREEPATRLLERIEAERKRLVREKKIKEAKPLPPITDDETPFTLPRGWKWARFGQVATITSNLVQPSAYPAHLHVAPDNIEKQTGRLLPCRTVREDEVRSANHLFHRGQLLYSKIRPNLAKATIVDFNGLCSADMYPISAHIDITYLLKYMLSSTFLSMAVKSDTRVAMPKINQDELNKIFVAVPPLQEQKRIVAKVGELMRLCDELERAQGEQREARQRLGRVILDELLVASDAVEVQSRWQTVSDHLSILTAAPEQVGKLRQTVLQLAVQGKLTRQDPRDEPASALHHRIHSERQRLVKEKKIKNADPLPPVNADEVPFALPSGWMWVRLGDFGPFWGGGTPSKSNPEYWQGDIPWVSPKDMKRLYISDSIDHITDEAIRQSTAQLIPQNSLLFVVRGMILAHSFPAALTLRDVTINQDMKALQLVNPDTAEFLLLACRGLKDEMLKRVVRSSHGTCRLESEDVERFPIPLPPLGEQKRIVAAVNNLTSLCDELEVGLRRREEEGERLLQAAVRSLPAPETKETDIESAELVA